MDCLDWIDPVSQEIGAVNTVLVRGDELHGFNTDADALVAPIIRRTETFADGAVQSLRRAALRMPPLGF